MPTNMFNQGMQQFVNPLLMKGMQGTLIPGTSQDVIGVSNVLGNVLSGNLGFTKQDQSGSFQFDPYQGGFSLDTPSGFGVSAYSNKMFSPGVGFHTIPMGQTIEGRFRFGAQPEPITNNVSIGGLPTDFDDQRSAGRRFADDYLSNPNLIRKAVKAYY